MSDAARHSRHTLFGPIGRKGQGAISQARVAIVGCGALGSRIAELLCRAGVGTAGAGLLRLIDRDYVELSNLQRQTLFTEEDATHSRPKATAAARHLLEIDSSLKCESLVRDLNKLNAARLLDAVDLIIDGTDNFHTRFLINDVAVHLRKPWIYGAAVGSRGLVAFVSAGYTPCLRCYVSEVPALGSVESCDTTGIITPLPSVVAGLQVAAALRWIVDGTFSRGVLSVDLWTEDQPFRRMFADWSPDANCPSCATGQLPSLSEEGQDVVTLCGRNSVQINATHGVDIAAAARRIRGFSAVEENGESMTATIDEGRLTLFSDGRVIVEGTTNALEAKAIVARYLGG